MRLFVRTFPLVAALVGSLSASAAAAPSLRLSVDQKGDFVMIGNTLGHDCDGAPAPMVGTVMCGGQADGDSAPDVYWRSEQPGASQALAATSVSKAQARSTSVLTLPPGATITHARLYWGAKLAGNTPPDTQVTLDRPGGATTSVTAGASGFVLNGGDTVYSCSADVTAFVLAQGPGAFRVADVDSKGFVGVNDSVSFAGWSLVVVYALATDPPRNIAIFDGLDQVSGGNPANATISGFLVPNAAFSARLGVLAYEGDASVNGDALFFNGGAALSDGENPANNFFNSTRSLLGAPVSTPGDLPQLNGAPGSHSGIDIDVVDITSKVTPGDTSAMVSATSTGDNYFLAAFVTSISTFKPDFSTAAKTVVDVDGGSIVPGDVLEYTIVVDNTGNDAAVGAKVVDALPVGVTYVPGSLQIAAGANQGALTDAAGDDQGEYDAGTRTVTVRLGTGADATNGGTLAVGASTTVKLSVTVDPSAVGNIANQAIVSGSGLMGAPSAAWPSGNGSSAGTPTTSVVDQCDGPTLCGGATPVCDTTGAHPYVCVGCLTSADCSGATPVCDLGTKTCNACMPTDGCGDADMDALTNDQEAALGTNPMNPDSDGDGIPDGTEAPLGMGVDTDGDMLVDALDDDDDGDGITTAQELALATMAGVSADVDGDGKPNRLDTDADGDGKPDAMEGTGDVDGDGIPNFLDKNDADGAAIDDDGDGVPNGTDNCKTTPNPTQADFNTNGKGDACEDTDGDGLLDAAELALGTSPTDADSDDDGISDGKEQMPGADTDGDGKKNALDPDADGDGLFDGTEVGSDCKGPGTDASKGTCIADADMGESKTNPLVADTDGDGLSDGQEDADKNGQKGATETDPNQKDTDKGGVDDGTELKNKTNPLDPSDDKGGAGGAAGQGGGGAGGAGQAGKGGAGQAGQAGLGGAGQAGKGGAGQAGLGGAGQAGKGGAGQAGAPVVEEERPGLEGDGCSTGGHGDPSLVGLGLAALALARRRRAR